MAMKKNIWTDGIMGVVIGDALGMPIQFLPRAKVRENPLTGMVSFGTYNKPVGTWSDDSSMTLATLDSIRQMQGIDPDDIMSRFVAWLTGGEYTPAGETFDQGNTCVEAIHNYIRSGDVSICGACGEWANGNGALMRIMPVCLYGFLRESKGELSVGEVI